MSLLRALICAALLLQAWPVVGQESAPDAESPETVADDSPTDGDSYETVIVGSRQERPLFEESRAVDLTTEQQIMERPGQTIADHLDEEAGVHAQHTNRGAGAPIIRGQVGPSNLIVFDGIRIDNGTIRTGPNQYLNLWDPYALDRIEVLRGPGGVLYGSDAVGGVIHLVPRRLSYGTGANARAVARYQTADNSFTVAPEVGFGGQHWSAVAGGSLSWFNELRVGGGGRLPASEYRQFSGHASVGWLPRPDDEISLNYRGTAVLDAGRVDRLDDSRFRSYDNANHLVYARYSHLGEGAFDEVTATLSLNLTNEVIARNDCERDDIYGLMDPDGDPIRTTVDPGGCIEAEYDAVRSVRKNEDDVATLGGSAVIHSRMPLPGLSFLWGTDLYQSFVDSSGLRRDKQDPPDPTNPGPIETETRGNFSNGSRYGFYSGFLRASQEVPIAEEWLSRLTFGFRLTHVRASAPDVPGLGDVDYADTGITGSAQLAFLLDRRLTVYGGMSQGFRPPNLQETTQLGDTGNRFEIPNDALKPERAQQWELGTRLRIGPVFLDFAGYILQIRDFITRAPATFNGQDEINGSPVVQRVNADEANYIGFESTMAFQLHPMLRLYGNLAWIDGEIREGQGKEAIETTPRRLPPLRWLAALRFEISSPAFFAELIVRGAAAQTQLSPGDLADRRICGSRQYPGVLLSDLGEECPGTAAWVDLGFRAGLVLFDQLTLRMALTNLLDTSYRLHGSGLDANGFGALFSIDWRY